MDCMVHGVAKNRTQLSDFHVHLHTTALYRAPDCLPLCGLHHPPADQVWASSLIHFAPPFPYLKNRGEFTGLCMDLI